MKGPFAFGFERARLCSRAARGANGKGTASVVPLASARDSGFSPLRDITLLSSGARQRTAGLHAIVSRNARRFRDAEVFARSCLNLYCETRKANIRMLTFVTGATGFLGSHVARALEDQGAKLRLLVRPTSNLKNLEGL